VAERLDAGVTVVTATRRLTRDLRRQFDARQVAAGRRAWPSADILPWHAFVARAWQGVAGDGGDLLLPPSAAATATTCAGFAGRGRLRRVAGRAAGLTRIASPGNFARDSAAGAVVVPVTYPVTPAVR